MTLIRGSALPSTAKSNRSHYQSKVFVCVSVISGCMRIIARWGQSAFNCKIQKLNSLLGLLHFHLFLIYCGDAPLIGISVFYCKFKDILIKVAMPYSPEQTEVTTEVTKLQLCWRNET